MPAEEVPPMMSWLQTFLFTLLIVGCAEKDLVRVDCGAPGPEGVDCDLKRTSGSSAVHVCWDLEITCANGGKMRGSRCHDIAAADKDAKANMPVDKFSDQDKCDTPKGGAVLNLVVAPR